MHIDDGAHVERHRAVKIGPNHHGAGSLIAPNKGPKFSQRITISILLYAKANRRTKRGGGASKISLEELGGIPAVDSCLPEVDEALELLAAMDPRKAE